MFVLSHITKKEITISMKKHILHLNLFNVNNYVQGADVAFLLFWSCVWYDQLFIAAWCAWVSISQRFPIKWLSERMTNRHSTSGDLLKMSGWATAHCEYYKPKMSCQNDSLRIEFIFLFSCKISSDNYYSTPWFSPQISGLQHVMLHRRAVMRYDCISLMFFIVSLFREYHTWL